MLEIEETNHIHISVGAGFENDRRDLGSMAVEALSQFDGPKYLIFECLAERTLARQVQANDLAAQVTLALSFVEPCWQECKAQGIKIIANFGGIAPREVARGLKEVLGDKARVIAVTGDELNIRIGNHRRNLVLPQALAALQPSGATMEDDYLKISFKDMAQV